MSAIDEKLKTIANSIRSFTGRSSLLDLDGINREVNRIIQIFLSTIDGSTTIPSNQFYNNSVLQKVSLPHIISLGTCAFESCDLLKEVHFQNVTTVGNAAFRNCPSLTTVNLPNAESIGEHLFRECYSLVNVYLPKARTIDRYAFCYCSSLIQLDLKSVTSIMVNSFYGCTKLVSLILRSDKVVTLSAKGAFTSTPIKDGTGYIYVPRALLSQYKVETNWSVFSAQFRALEDYTDDGTSTGQLEL